MDTKQHGMKRETIVVSFVLAMLEAVGIFFVVLLFLGLAPRECDFGWSVSAFSVLFAGIWGWLLCRNC